MQPSKSKQTTPVGATPKEPVGANTKQQVGKDSNQTKEDVEMKNETKVEIESQESGELREVNQLIDNPNDPDGNAEDPNKHGQALNCSSMSIYNIYLSGSRVTRNRLKKEEPIAVKEKTPDAKKFKKEHNDVVSKSSPVAKTDKQITVKSHNEQQVKPSQKTIDQQKLQNKKVAERVPKVKVENTPQSKIIGEPKPLQLKKRDEKIMGKSQVQVNLLDQMHKARQAAKDQVKKDNATPPKIKKEQIVENPVIQPIDSQKKGDELLVTQITRHLSMIDKFEQHFPHFQFIASRYILYSDSTAQIQSIKSVQSFREYDRLQAQVKIYADNPSIPMNVKVFKYLSRVFYCPLKHIDIEELSDEVRECINNTSENILIVQVIDNSNKYENGTQRFSSHFPMQFYALGQDDMDERLVLSGPVVFKNLISEQDACLSQSNMGKLDLLTDLIPFTNDSTLPLCYKSEFTKYITNQSKNITQRFQEYKDKVQRVVLDEKNVFSAMFTLCTFDNNEGQRRKGVLVSVKFDQQINGYMLLIRQVQMKQSQKEKSEWFPLTNSQNQEDGTLLQKYHFSSEFYRGFVSLEYLKTLDNTYSTGAKLRSKHLTFLSHEQSFYQQNKTLNVSVFQQPEEQKIETLADLTALEDDSKVSNVVSKSAVRSEYSYISTLQQQGTTSCSKCNYIKEGISVLNCSECKNAWHVQCLENGEYEQKISAMEKLWRCPACIRCTHCHSMVGSQKRMLVCKCCNTPYHPDCLDPSFRSQVPQSILDFEPKSKETNASETNNTLLQVDFKCQTCIKCISCGSREAGKSRLSKWSKDFNFCSNCNRKRKYKQFCQVCEEMWHSDKIDDLVKEGSKQMICCNSCQTWSHITCDLILLNTQIKEQMLSHDSYFQYCCQTCRKSKRMKFITQLISELQGEDKNGYYSDEFWLEGEQFNAAQSKQYLRQIKNPICFDIIRRRIQIYLNNPENLKSDCLQIFLNAKNYNRQNTAIYRDAEKMYQICLEKLNKYMNQLVRQSESLKKEEMYLKLIISKSEYLQKLRQHEISIQWRGLEGEQHQLKQFEQHQLAQIVDRMKSEVFIIEEHYADNETADVALRQEFMANQSAPIAYTDKNANSLRSTNRRNVRRIDYKEGNLAAAANNSAQQQTNNIYEDKSAPCEFAIPLDHEMESPDILKNDGMIGEETTLKRQKIHDNYETIANNISIMLEQQQSSDQPHSALQNHLPSDVHSKGKLDKLSASATNSIINPINLKDKSLRKMMEHYKREDDEACYYTNAIRCSFDDPRLIFEEMCYLCGSFGNQHDFVTCTLCAESFHTYCLQLPSNEIQSMYQSNWKCLNCKACEVCGKATDEDLLMFCGTCDRPFHSFCLTPKINNQNTPEQWKCDHCFKCKSCGTRKYYNERDIELGINLKNNDYSLSKNFSLCYECGQNEHKKQECNICHGATSHEMNRQQETLQCQSCSLYSHVSCSRVTHEMLNSLLEEANSKIEMINQKLTSVQSVYKCFDCLIKGKTINFLILESCLQYENIHKLIQKQKLLGEICQELLANYFPERFREKVPLFLDKFILQNQKFFQSDKVVQEWLDLFQVDVYFEPNDFGMQYTQIETISQEDQIKDKSQDIEITNEEIQLNVQKKTEISKFNPFASANELEFKSYTENRRPLYLNMFSTQPPLQRYSTKSEMTTETSASGLLDSQQVYQKLYESKEKREKLVDFLINDESEEESQSSSWNTGLVESELKAVFRIKMQFFQWFEKFFSSTMKVFSGQCKNTQSLPPVSASNEKVELVKAADEHHEQYEIESKNGDTSESVVGCSEDTVVANPQSHISCLLCKQKGEFSVTGRLIPYKLNMYVHTNCALWTNEVFDIDDGQIVNFYQQQKKLIHQKCGVCNELGATLSCAKTKGCNKHFHFPCAYRSGRVTFTKMKEIFCEVCIKQKGISQNAQGQQQGPAKQISGDITDQNNTGTFPADYMKKKRLYIVRNLEEINQQDYENDEDEAGKPQSKLAGKGTKEKDLQHSLSATPKKREATSTNSAQPKEVEADKWRPFYFDLFNRVGNLTVLSLRKEVNQLIDIITKDNTANGASSIQAYVQQQQQLYQPGQTEQTLSRQDKISSGQNSNLIEELRKYLDLFSDYATIRIYWKFYQDKKQTVPASGKHDPRSLKRAYFLYINRTKRIIELDKGDLKTVMEYCSQQIRSNPETVYILSQAQKQLNQRAQQFDVSEIEHLSQDVVWQRIMGHFRSQRSDFSLQNIEFCVEKLFGLAKYPISVWNQLQLTNNDLKYNLNTQKSKLNFFLKSAASVIHASTMSFALYSQAQKSAGAGAAGSLVPAPQSKREQLTAAADINNTNILAGRVITLDGVFQRMVKINNLERNEVDQFLSLSQFGSQNYNASNIFTNNNQKMNQLDQLSINQISVKHMDYNQTMIALGRGRKVDIGDHFRRLNEQKQNNANKGSAIENSLLMEQLEKKHRKKSLEQPIQENVKTNAPEKELSSLHNHTSSKLNKSNLPIAMQYRSSLLNPKKVEVGPSKIHRIGLFTNEGLKPKDIVIEYVGEIIRTEVGDTREKRYDESGIGDCYMFRLDNSYIIDATYFGGKARYLNHSCDANCSAKTINVDNQKHIIIRAKKAIHAGEELTYNYNFEQEEDKMSCFCGAKNCIGCLN